MAQIIDLLPLPFPLRTRFRCTTMHASGERCQGQIVKLAGVGHACRSCGAYYSPSTPPGDALPVEAPLRFLIDDDPIV